MQPKSTYWSKKWLKDLKLEHYNWNLAFTQISKICKENKLREFNYKLLHRIVTKKEVYAYVFIAVNPTPFCIPLSSAKCLRPPMIKLFPGLIKQTTIFANNRPKTFGMLHKGNDQKNSLDSTIVFSLSNISYIVKNVVVIHRGRVQ